MPTQQTSGSPPEAGGGDDAVHVFMSYRRTDDPNFTGRFHDKLIGVFGEANVFRDIDSIPAGTRFEDVITDRLEGVDAVLALIGPTWGARLDAPIDFVRMEIVHALKKGTPVIPVLIEDTPLPTAESLPPELRPLLDRQTVRVRRDPDFHRDAARVVDGVRQAVRVQRERAAARRRAEAEAAERARLEAEAELERAARRRELEAELAELDARAAEERRQAEALERQRAQRAAELARLEEEATARRVADERAVVAEMASSQAAREREAAATEAIAAELREELAELPDTSPTATEPVVASVVEPATDVDDAVALDVNLDLDAVDPAEPARVDDGRGLAPASRPSPAEPVAVAPTDDVDAPDSRRTVADASRAELVGALLLVVAVAWAVRALFQREDYDGSNAFSEPWASDVLAVVLTVALLAPLLAYHYARSVPPVVAGTSIGYLAYQGLSDSSWFESSYGGESFPTDMVIIALLLGGAWYAFRRDSPVQRRTIAHPPSRYLQVGASLAGLAATVYYCDLIAGWKDDTDVYILYVQMFVSLVMVVLSFRRSEESSTALATLAATATVSFLAYAVAYEDLRDRAANVVLASGVLAVTAYWRAHRAPSSAAVTSPAD